MKYIAAVLLLASVAQALPGVVLTNHRNLINPVFQKAFFKSTPSGPSAEGFEYHALICIENGGICSGALVDQDKVITTAQCVDGATHLEVHFNALHIHEPQLDANRVIINSTNYLKHEQFSVDFRGALHDIAIIYLDRPVTEVAPVNLPTKSDDWPLDEMLLTKAVGYGVTDGSEVIDGMSVQPYLTGFSTSTSPNSICKGTYGPFIDSTYHLCVTAPAISSCYGDPGTPLTHDHVTFGRTLIGLASFGSKAFCETGAPTIFTTIRPYLNWLEANGVPVQS